MTGEIKETEGEYAILVGRDGTTFRTVIVDNTGQIKVIEASASGMATNIGLIKTAVEIIDNFITGTRGLVTEDNSNAIKTAVELIDNAISGTEMQVDVVDLLGVDTVYDHASGNRSLLVARGHGKSTFRAEYETAQTNTVILTCTSSQRIDVVGVYISGDGAAGEVRLIWACSRDLIFPHYMTKYNQSGQEVMHISGLAGESVQLITTTGTDKVYVLVLYRIVDAEAADFPELTVADWQANPATGTATEPEKTNDNNDGTYSIFDAVGEYCEIMFNVPFYVNKFRYLGFPTHQKDGTYKLQYFDCDTQAWVDWKTGIPTRLNTWSDWADLDLVLTKKVRIVATALDTQFSESRSVEWELKYEA